jgi:hypothetical protein
MGHPLSSAYRLRCQGGVGKARQRSQLNRIGCWQFDRERAPTVRPLTLGGNRPAVQFHESFGEREAHAQTAGAATRPLIDLLKQIEDARERFLRQTRSGILHRNPDALLAQGGYPERDPRPGRGVLGCVR